jgi:hypothetical protein
MKPKLAFVNVVVIAILLANCASPVSQVAAPPMATVPIVHTAAQPIEQPFPIAARAIQAVQTASLSDDLTRHPRTEPPLDNLPPEVIGKREMVAQRTAASATFDMGDGSYTLIQDARPLHYQDQQGR